MSSEAGVPVQGKPLKRHTHRHTDRQTDFLLAEPQEFHATDMATRPVHRREGELNSTRQPQGPELCKNPTRQRSTAKQGRGPRVPPDSQPLDRTVGKRRSKGERETGAASALQERSLTHPGQKREACRGATQHAKPPPCTYRDTALHIRGWKQGKEGARLQTQGSHAREPTRDKARTEAG